MMSHLTVITRMLVWARKLQKPMTTPRGCRIDLSRQKLVMPTPAGIRIRKFRI